MRHFRLFSVLAVIAIVAAACGADPTVAAEASAGVDAAVDSVAVAETAEVEPVVDESEVVAETEEVAEAEPEPEPAAPLTASASTEATFGEEFPDIIGAEARQDANGAWTFNVTVSSPYDTPQRYADAWRVVDPDGNELGIRILTHDHASEQPFTRSQGGIQIPEGVSEVTVQGRDLANGWGGGELVVALP